MMLKLINHKVAPNFYISELKCPCGCNSICFYSPMDYFMQVVRYEVGEIEVISATRCISYNKKIGGYVQSYHLEGKARDAKAKEVSHMRFLYECEKAGFSGIGVGAKYLHLEVDTPYKRYYYASEFKHMPEYLQQYLIDMGYKKYEG